MRYRPTECVNYSIGLGQAYTNSFIKFNEVTHKAFSVISSEDLRSNRNTGDGERGRRKETNKNVH